MAYHLGQRSRKELQGVHPLLVQTVERAIQLTEQDFTVVDGVRTIEEQRAYVDRGVSQTMHSKHLLQRDGHGHAVDLVPYINGKIRWEVEPCYLIAKAMREAALDVDSRLIWGGCWELLDDPRTPEAMVKSYVDKRIKQGRSAFVDAVHYQLWSG